MRILLLLMVGHGTCHAYFKIHDYLFHEINKIFKLKTSLLKNYPELFLKYYSLSHKN